MTSTLYKTDELLTQAKALVKGEPDLIANMSNMSAFLKEHKGYFWVGFYLLKNNELVLGPFQGPIACTRIPEGKGVCGRAVAQAKTMVVDDVYNFEGHIACSPDSKSEIVVPLIKGEQCIGVLDVDSESYAAFDKESVDFLESIAQIVMSSYSE
jgi:L-methionine (R)-S-oxide reductase